MTQRTIFPRTQRSVLLQFKAMRLWTDRNRLIDLRTDYGMKNGRDATTARMQEDIDRLAQRAERCEERSRELWNTPYLADEECDCGPNPDAPACPSCRARSELQDVPY